MATYGPVHATVHAVTDVSPSFRRIVFTGAGLDILEGPFFDQRIKLIFPTSTDLPDLGSDPDWYRAWLALPQTERGSMRTYSIRDVTRRYGQTLLTVDFAMHGGTLGPAAAWASRARPGDELIIIIPLEGRASGGIEFAPGEADRIVLLGDETAAPAIARILDDLPASAGRTATAYIEVPNEEDRMTGSLPIRWLARGERAKGECLAEALGWHLSDGDEAPAEELVWETPLYSATGEEPVTPPATGTYYWIAGESGVVTRLRRHLVREIGIDRSRVAFMGYWREGVAMRG